MSLVIARDNVINRWLVTSFELSNALDDSKFGDLFLSYFARLEFFCR